MQLPKLKSIIEGLLFAAGEEGLELKQLAEVLELDVAFVATQLQELKQELQQTQRGIQVVEIAGALQLTTLAEHAPYLERLATSPSRAPLSQAALETLSIVAYKQPVTRVQIEEIRGVKSDRALQTLVMKDLIEEKGRAEAVGRPILYGTTRSFLEYFALKGLHDLPDSSQFEHEVNLEEETRLLFEKLEERQLTLDETSEN